MKKFFSSIFNAHPQVKNISKDKEDDLIDRLENETYLSNEFRFQHQNEKYQLRATPNEKVTLGVLLNRTFDIRQEEVSDLYIVTDNIHEKKGILVVDSNEIWSFDLCNAVLIKQDNGDMGYRFSENVILSISYRKGYVKQEDDDKSISENFLLWRQGIGCHTRARPSALSVPCGWRRRSASLSTAFGTAGCSRCRNTGT